MVGPGEMFPPRYSPIEFMKSKVTHVPMSMTRTSLPGWSQLAPTTAARRSEPSVSGVLYLFIIGTLVIPLLNSIMLKGNDESAAEYSSLMSETEEQMPLLNG